MKKVEEREKVHLAMRLRDKIIYPVKRMFLRKKTFIGDYADTLTRMTEWALNQNIIIQYYAHTEQKFQPVGQMKDITPQERKELKAFQAKIIKKKLNKQKQMMLFYVEDNQITRGLGWNEKPDHFKIKGMSELMDSATRSFITRSDSRMNAYKNRRTRRKAFNSIKINKKIPAAKKA